MLLQACRPVFPLRISLQASSLQENEAQNLLRLTQHALDDLNEFSAHHLRLQLAKREPVDARSDDGDVATTEQDVALSIRLTPGESMTATLHPYEPILDITYAPHSLPSATSSSSTLAAFVATQLRQTFAEEQAIISYLLSAAASSSSPAESQQQQQQGSQTSYNRLPLSPETAEALAKRTTRSLRYAPTYHLTFSLFTSGAAPSAWDIETAVDRFVRPVLDVLAPIHNFTVDSQVQLYATPGVSGQQLSSGKRVLMKDDLSSFINAAEWPLSPSIGGAPTINFIVFVGDYTISLLPKPDQPQQQPPEAEAEPVVDAEDNIVAEAQPPPPEPELDPAATSQSWLIPQWGSVYLLSGIAPGQAHVPVDALEAPMTIFTGHLLTLLGLPTSSASTLTIGPSSQQQQQQPLQLSLPLRLATLSRVRAADLLLRASSTLGSLARLTLALPSISIPQSVADGVAGTIAHLELACAGLGDTMGSPSTSPTLSSTVGSSDGEQTLADGELRKREVTVKRDANVAAGGAGSGLWHAREAAREAERAFFEKSMVGQLYFPDEHKVAVYLPLLGPIAVPLVMGLLNEFKGWRRRRRAAVAAAAEGIKNGKGEANAEKR